MAVSANASYTACEAALNAKALTADGVVVVVAGVMLASPRC